MKKIIAGFYGLFLTVSLFAQDYNPDRYQESIFPGVLSILDVKYGEAPQWVWPYWDIDLELDVYVPMGDDNPKRPLIIFAHAGGFINGSKNVDNMVAICDSFARKGFVTAAIDYRKGFDPLDGESAERAVYRGIQDGKAAIRYFKEYASLYDIDTNYVFFAGMSAGGFIALNVGYMNDEEDRPESTYGGGLVNDLLCLDCAGNEYTHTSKIMAVLDFWGAVDDTLLIEADEPPLLIIHGENDPVVSYVYDHPFGVPTLPETYGGLPISERAESVGLYYEKYTSTGDLHMLDGSDNGTFPEEGPNSFWSDTLLPRTEQFLYKLLKPNTIRMSDEFTDACYEQTLTLAVSDSLTSHYIWDFDTDLITVVSDDNSGEIELQFSNSGAYEITVVEFNSILCPGDTISFTVNVSEEIIPAYTTAITDFNTVAFTNESTGGISYHWDFGDGETSTDESPTHTYLENGSYDITLIVTNELGCTETLITELVIEGLGIGSNKLNDVVIYPNPFKKQLTIKTNQPIANLLIQDAAGRIIYTNTTNNSKSIEVSTDNWATGIYFIGITQENGSFITKKIIKY